MPQARGANGRFTGGGGGSLGDATGTIRLRSDTSGADDATRALRDVENAATNAARRSQTAAKTMLAAGGIIAAGFLLAVRSAAEFQQKLSAIQAVSGATTAQMEQIRIKALQLGKDTQFSAGESANAIEELVKAGISVADVLGGAADATVALAAATGVDMPRAAGIASNAMNEFHLRASDLSGVVNQLAGAANASAIDINELGDALSYVGPVAHALGLSINDTSTAIAILGNNGIKGSSAGTALRAILSNLTPITKRATQAFREQGLITADNTNLFLDANGALLPLDQIIQILSDHTKDLNATQRNTFSKKAFGLESLAATSVLMGETANSVNAMTDSIAKTTAADVAATRMRNLSGSFEQLKGSTETLAIVIGTPLLGALTAVVDKVNVVTGVFLSLPAPLRDFIALATGLSGVLLLAAGSLLFIVPKIRALRIELALLANTALYQRIATGFASMTAVVGGPWVAAIGAATLVLGLLFLAHRKGKPSIDGLTEAIKADSGALAENSRVTVANALEKSGALKTAQQYKLSLSDLTEASLGNADAQQRLGARIAELRAPLDGQIAALSRQTGANGLLTKSAYDQRAALIGQKADLDGLTQTYKDNTVATHNDVATTQRLAEASADAGAKATATGAAIDERFNAAMGRSVTAATKATGAAGALKTGVKDVGAEAETASGAVTKLKTSIEQLFGIAIGAPRALDAFQSKINGLTKLVKENGAALQGNTDKAIANRAGIFDAADAIAAYADAALAGGASQDEVAAKVQGMTNKLYASAGAAGFSKSQVQKLTGALKSIPGSINPEILVRAQDAIDKARALKRLLDSFHDITANVSVKAHTSNLRGLELQAGIPQMAAGGVVTSPTLALLGEGRQSEAVLPLDQLHSILRAAWSAGRTTVHAAQSTAGGPAGSSGGSGAPTAHRLVSGTLKLDPSGHAFIRGIAEDVADGNDQFTRAYARMGG